MWCGNKMRNSNNILKFYKDKKVLVTGHTGFKGSWLCRILVNSGTHVTGYSLEPPTNPCIFEISNINDRVNTHIIYAECLRL